MDDASLQAFLNLSDEEWAKLQPKLSPERRATYERMAEVCIDLNMGVVPHDVIACIPKGCRHD